MILINRIRKYLSQEKAILYSTLGTVWRVIFSPVSLILVTYRLTPEMQGFYYLFFSIAGMQQIIEAGFSHTLVQAISHEMGEVKFEDNKLIGNYENVNRIKETMRMGFSWYIIISIACILVIYPAGVLIMGHEHMDKFELWFGPWTVFIILFAVNILLYPVNFFFEGIQQLDRIYKNRFIIQIVSSICFISFLFLGLKLYSIVAFSICSFIINLTTLYFPNRNQFNEYIFKLPTKAYVKSIWKWQLKVSIVWSSGYLYWQLPTVIIFSLLGPVLSGQYNMTINIINAITNIGQVFIKTKAAIIGKLRALNLLMEALPIYYKNIKISYAITFLGLILLTTIWLILPSFKIWERILPFSQVIALGVTFSINLVTLNQAMFARCSKEEPFFAISMFANFAFPILLFILLKIYISTWSIVLSFFALHLIQFTWGNKVFSKLFLNKK
jgi:O-antigen/teichoic acid export membrane protein